MVNGLIVRFLTTLNIVRTQMAFETKKIYHRMEFVHLEDDIRTYLKRLHEKQIQENGHDYDSCRTQSKVVVVKYSDFVLYSSDLRCNSAKRKRKMKMMRVEVVLAGQEVVYHSRVWLTMVRKLMMSHCRLTRMHLTYSTFYPKTCLK